MAAHLISSRNAVRPGVIRSECKCGEVFEGQSKDTDARVMAHIGIACDCPAFDEVHGWHTTEDHAADCAGSIATIEPCGGCWGCLALQAARWARLDREPTSTTTTPEEG